MKKYLPIILLLSLAACDKLSSAAPKVEAGVKGEYVILHSAKEDEGDRSRAYKEIDEMAKKTCPNGWRSRGKRLVTTGGIEKIKQSIECLKVS